MFEKYDGIIDIEQVLQDKYNYHFDGNFSNFYNQSFVELEADGKSALFWIIYNDERFLFKPVEEFDYNVWGELLSAEIAKELGIPCALYRVGIFNGKLGIISKSFLKKDDTLVLGSQIFQEFFNNFGDEASLFQNSKFLEEYQIPNFFLGLNSYDKKRYTFNFLNNLEQVKSILDRDTKVNEKQVYEIMKNMTNMLLFDLITLQGDRHPNNWGIIKNDNVTFSPLFDNGVSFGLGFPDMNRRCNDFRSELFNSKYSRNRKKLNSFIYQVRPNFTLSNKNVIDVSTRLKDEIPKVLEELFYKLDFDTQTKITNIISKLSNNILDEMIKNIEKMNNIKMSDDVYFYISSIFEININNLKEVIDNCWRNVNYESRKHNKSI